MPTLLTLPYPYSVDLNRLDEILLYTTSNKIRKGKLNRGFLRSKLRDVLASSRTNQRTNERTSELSRAKERARFFVSLLLFFLFFSFLFARGSSFWRRWKILEPGDKTIDPEYLDLSFFSLLFATEKRTAFTIRKRRLRFSPQLFSTERGIIICEISRTNEGEIKRRRKNRPPNVYLPDRYIYTHIHIYIHVYMSTHIRKGNRAHLVTRKEVRIPAWILKLEMMRDKRSDERNCALFPSPRGFIRAGS